MRTRFLIGFVGVLLVAMIAVPAWAKAPSTQPVMETSITVIGTGNPAIDVPAVQNAVDNFDTVTLNGTFDFGFDWATGGIDITRLDVTLQGPATILNGGKYIEIPELPGYWFQYPLSIQAPGATIRSLEFSGSWDTGILVYVQDEGEPVEIYDNIIDAYWAAIYATATEGGLKVTDNTLSGGYCYSASETAGETEISYNDMQCWSGVAIYPFNHKLDISNNKMNLWGGDGIFIGAWRVTPETGPEWGDNPPVRIIDNTIHLTTDYFAGIMIGTSAHGISNATVRGNTLTGEAGYGGLVKQPYGHNNRFIDNDLSGLTTYSPQIWVLGGRDNLFSNNKLGNVEGFSVGYYGPAFRDTATLISAVNWHMHDAWNTPDPVNTGNHFSNNDYSLTGVPGWIAEPDEAFGAVLLLDFLQRFDPGWTSTEDPVPYEVPFAMENYVAESDFPTGTDRCTQVLDLSNLQGDDLTQGTNTVAGWTACEAHARKESFELVSDRYRDFGQYLKEMMEKRNELWMEENPPHN